MGLGDWWYQLGRRVLWQLMEVLLPQGGHPSLMMKQQPPRLLLLLPSGNVRLERSLPPRQFTAANDDTGYCTGVNELAHWQCRRVSTTFVV